MMTVTKLEEVYTKLLCETDENSIDWIIMHLAENEPLVQNSNNSEHLEKQYELVVKILERLMLVRQKMKSKLCDVQSKQKAANHYVHNLMER